MNEIKHTESRPDLNVLVDYWRPKLRLQDWRIQIAYSEIGDIDRDKQAIVSWTINKKSATILISPLDLRSKNDREVSDPIEKTVIHELVHLHFAPFQFRQDDRPTEIIEEQAVESITCALYSMRYPDYQHPTHR